MGALTRPQVDSFNPNPPSIQPAQAQAGSFLEQFIRSPQGAGGQFTQSGLGNLAATQLAQQIGVNASPEQNILQQLLPSLLGMASGTNGVANPFQELGFGQQFRELQDPFGALGGQGAGQNLVGSLLPAFSRGLQDTLTQVSNRAPNRFSSALAQQGRDVGTQALQDFNILAREGLLQGLNLDLQDRGQARSFAQGARGLQQGAVNDLMQAQLGARGLQQQAELGFQGLGQQGTSNALGAASLLGQLAAQAGNNPFQRMLAAGQFGQSQLNPAISILQSGLGFLQPQRMDAVVGASPFEHFLGLLQTAAQFIPGSGGK